MTFLDQATEFIKVWTPWIAAGGFVFSVYRQLRNRITEWAGKLLDNHLFHVQQSLENLEVSQTEMISTQKEQIELLKRIAEK